MWIILKKTLVYYQGRAPRGIKTDWVMNEYRLSDLGSSSASGPAHSKEDIVLCKVYRKATAMKELEQRAAIEEASTRASRYMTSMMVSGVSSENFIGWATTVDEDLITNSTANIKGQTQIEILSSSSALNESVDLPEIEVPMHNNLEWSQDSLLNQLRSPWIDQWSPYANVLHF